MAVIYELRGNGCVFRTGNQLVCRVCRWVSELPRLFGSRALTWERMDHGAAGLERIFCSSSSTNEKNGGRSPRNRCLPGPTPTIRRRGPLTRKQASYPRAIPPLRVQVATLCGMRSRLDFDILLAKSLEILNAYSLSVGTPAQEEWGAGLAPIAERIPGRSRRAAESTLG